MTHPPAGPSSPPPPPGPRYLTTDERIARTIAAELAGDCGWSATPLHRRRRERNYWRQNGGERLTPKQRRRLEHKALRAAVKAA